MSAYLVRFAQYLLCKSDSYFFRAHWLRAIPDQPKLVPWLYSLASTVIDGLILLIEKVTGVSPEELLVMPIGESTCHSCNGNTTNGRSCDLCDEEERNALREAAYEEDFRDWENACAETPVEPIPDHIYYK